MKRAGDVRWGVEQRLEFIEFRLFWNGGVNRSDITRHFGVSVLQASKDLGQYQELAPKNIVYNRSEKRYLRAEKFSPQFLRPDPDQYLLQLQGIAHGVVLAGETWLAAVPAMDAVRLPHRNVHIDILRTMLEAVQNRKALEVRYQSLTPQRPNAEWRWISPHAFVFDGHRWHVRAFAHEDREFADFALPRFMNIRKAGEAAAGPGDDAIWNELVSVEIKPHPGLNEDQKRIVAADFGMKSDRVSVSVRLALLYYLLRRLNLDFQEEQRPPHQQHVVLANPARVRQWVERARLF